MSTSIPNSPNNPFTRQNGEGEEEYVRRNFWAKLKTVAGKIPFAADALAMYYAVKDPATPKWAKAIAISGLAYFILPMDVIPDFLVIAGWTDDAAILAGALKTLSTKVTDEHREKANAWIKGRKRLEQLK